MDNKRNVQTKTASSGVKINEFLRPKPVNSASDPLVQKASGPQAVKPTPAPVPAKEPASTPEKKSKETKKTKKSLILYLILAIIFVAIIVAVIILAPKGGSDPTEADGTSSFQGEELTEEEKKETEAIMEEYAEVTVEGYQEVEDELGLHKAIIINVKNISDERVSLAINVVAKDESGNILDKSSLYAEGIEPGQTQVFQAFVYSELTEDQLKSAKYEVYKARTYETPTPETSETSDSATDETIEENNTVEENNTTEE